MLNIKEALKLTDIKIINKEIRSRETLIKSMDSNTERSESMNNIIKELIQLSGLKKWLKQQVHKNA